MATIAPAAAAASRLLLPPTTAATSSAHARVGQTHAHQGIRVAVAAAIMYVSFIIELRAAVVRQHGTGLKIARRLGISRVSA